ncbi:hypothetical protein GPALN_014760 [Globodera pallida]|nr:hypothetical protein GPALN_014760 [Globodera pallida]
MFGTKKKPGMCIMVANSIVCVLSHGDENVILGVHPRLIQDQRNHQRGLPHSVFDLPRFKTWRFGTGSWWVQTLCTVFGRYGGEEEICSMLTQVNGLMTEMVRAKIDAPAEEYRQTPEHTSSLMKRQFLFFVAKVLPAVAGVVGSKMTMYLLPVDDTETGTVPHTQLFSPASYTRQSVSQTDPRPPTTQLQ